MSGISKDIFYTIARIRVTFTSTGRPNLVVVGSGFWVFDNDEKPVFVTNSHNLDPTVKLGNDTPYRKENSIIEIELRKRNSNGLSIDTRFFMLEDAECKHHLSADCTIIKSIEFRGHIAGYQCNASKIDTLADQAFFKDIIWAMDDLSFIGYPENWYDTQANLPIARHAAIASLPDRPFVNDLIKTTDVVLVSGHSFAGSSGSPVILHHQVLNTNLRPKRTAMLIGIMSGHFKEENNKEPDRCLSHSGLSYFTRSTAILGLLK